MILSSYTNPPELFFLANISLKISRSSNLLLPSYHWFPRPNEIHDVLSSKLLISILRPTPKEFLEIIWCVLDGTLHTLGGMVQYSKSAGNPC